MMTDAEAAWVREHVWTPAMRKVYADTPGYWEACPCQWQGQCQHGEQCARREPLVRPIGSVLRSGGYAAFFAEPYAHPTPVATGPKRTRQAQVWYADRTCRWVCTCDCHADPDPEAVLAWIIRQGLVPPDTTVDELMPPAYRAYRAEMVHQARLRDIRRRQEQQAAAQQQRAAERDRAFRAQRDRKDAIREWGEVNGWRVPPGRLPRQLVEAYEVAVEGGDGQGTLF